MPEEGRGDERGGITGKRKCLDGSCSIRVCRAVFGRGPKRGTQQGRTVVCVGAGAMWWGVHAGRTSISSTMSYGTPASARSTLSCPGMRPATGWMAKRRLTPCEEEKGWVNRRRRLGIAGGRGTRGSVQRWSDRALLHCKNEIARPPKANPHRPAGKVSGLPLPPPPLSPARTCARSDLAISAMAYCPFATASP